MRYLLLSLIFCATCDSSGRAQENATTELAPFPGTWGLESLDGYGSWLKVEQGGNGKLEASLLWRVGSPRKPLRVEQGADSLTLVFRRNRKVDGKRIPIDVRYEVRRLPGAPDRVEVTETRFDKNAGQLPANKQSAIARGPRLPKMPMRPDLKKVRFGPQTMLFDGETLAGWQLKPASAKNGWRVENGELVNVTPKTDFSAYGEFGNLRTLAEFKDHQLHIEFKVQKDCNSGVYVRGMYEAQVVDRDSRMQGIQGVGAIFGRIAPSKQAGRAGGEWQTYDITLVDRHITVVLNGQTVIDNQPVEGCTGGALLGDVTKPGPLYLQGDHTSVRYRNIYVRKRVQ